MKAWALPATLLLLALWPAAARASGSLELDVDGYVIAMEVGDDTAPALARVRYFAPGDVAGVELEPQDLRVEAFDPARRRLRLQHRGSRIAPRFELRVDGERGVLEIDGRRRSAPFDWQM